MTDLDLHFRALDALPAPLAALCRAHAYVDDLQELVQEAALALLSMLAKPTTPTLLATVTPAATQAMSPSEVQGGIEKIDSSNVYSKLYLEQPEHRDLLEAILEKCKQGNEVVANQCDIAVAAKKSVVAKEREAAMFAAVRRARQEQAPDSKIMLPFEQTIVK